MRYSVNRESTLGLMFINSLFHCYTLEDEKREVKVAGETRIPSGRYEVIYRVSEDSTKTIGYRNKYYWFKYHLMLKDVPNFTYVYLHVGNTDDDTDGCILVGNNANNNNLIDGNIGDSGKAFEKFYKAVSRALDSGEKVFITVVDEDTLVRKNGTGK